MAITHSSLAQVSTPTNSPPVKKPPAKKNYRKDYTITDLTPVEKSEITQFDKRFSAFKSQVSKVMAIAILIFVPSVLVLFGGALATTLPGANVLSTVSVNAFLPGSIGILLSIPFFYQAYRPSNNKRVVRDEWLNRSVEILNARLIKPEDVSFNDFVIKGGEFIQFNLVPEGNQVYQLEYLRNLKEKYPKETKIRAEVRIKRVIDKATGNVIRHKKRTEVKVAVKDISIK